jgi:dTDP-4-dehydrorhamnose reductase
VFRTLETPEPRAAWIAPPASARPLLIAGATGTLGKALARACEWRGIAYRLTRRAELDLADACSIAAALDTIRPWAVINAAGWVRVDDAEQESAACQEANADGAVRLARACAERGLPVVGFSSDLVFDGRLGRPYLESDPPSPLNVYGRSKAEAEQAILALDAQALMIRTSAFFSPYDPYNFAHHVVRTLAAGRPFEAAADLVVSPTYVPDLVNATLDLLLDGETGLRHLANDGEVSWAEFARRIALAMTLDPGLVRDRRHGEFGWAAPRPAEVVLATERGRVMPPLDEAIARFAAIMAEVDFPPEAEAAAEGGGPSVPVARSAAG